jgi:amino acid transporter
MPLRTWVAAGVLTTGLSLAGLWYVVTHTQPTDMMQAMFLILAAVTLIGLTVVFAAYLNHRFARSNWLRKDPLRLLREGVGVALFGVLCAWLQKENYLNLTIAAIIGAVLLLMETFFLTRGKE